MIICQMIPNICGYPVLIGQQNYGLQHIDQMKTLSVRQRKPVSRKQTWRYCNLASILVGPRKLNISKHVHAEKCSTLNREGEDLH